MRLPAADFDDALHEDPGSVHLFGIDLARFDQLLHLGDRDAARHRAQRVEVARRLVKDEVPVRSPMLARTSAKSVTIPSSSTYSRTVEARERFFGDAIATEPSGL
jgi:hypothetical protein